MTTEAQTEVTWLEPRDAGGHGLYQELGERHSSSEPPQGTDPVHTLTADFWPLELERILFCCSKPPVCGHS